MARKGLLYSFVFSLYFLCVFFVLIPCKGTKKIKNPSKARGFFLKPWVTFDTYEVEFLKRAIFFLFEVIIDLYSVISFAVGGVLCRGYYIRANRAPGLSDGAIYLEKVKAHDLAFHFCLELDICPRFFETL